MENKIKLSPEIKDQAVGKEVVEYCSYCKSLRVRGHQTHASDEVMRIVNDYHTKS